MQYEMLNRRLHGSMGYKFESKMIFDHNRWRKSILLAVEYGKSLEMFRPLKVREAAFWKFKSIASQYRQIFESEEIY